MKSGNLNFLEPSGPLQAYNGTALPFTFISSIVFHAVLHPYMHHVSTKIILPCVTLNMNWNKINLKVCDEALLLNCQVFWTVLVVLPWCKNMTCCTVAVRPSYVCLKINLIVFALITLALMIMSTSGIKYYSVTLSIQWLVLSRFLVLGLRFHSEVLIQDWHLVLFPLSFHGFWY
jgi:hypothetical protein